MSFQRQNILPLMRSTPITEDSGDQNPRVLSIAEHVLILAATALICASILQAEPLQSANDRSRWATVWSLVERGTFQIDEIDYFAQWSTIDKVRYRTNDAEPWHFYSSKPPLLSVIVAGLYSVERWTLGLGLFNHTAFVTRLLLLIVNGLPFWFALRSLCRCLKILDTAPSVRMFVVAVAGFGSMLNPYLTTLNNHTPAAAAAMLAITAAVEILSRRHHKTYPAGQAAKPDTAFFTLGFFAALTCCFELPAALLGVLSFGLVWITDRRLTLTRYIPAALIPLAAFFITNWMVTGGAKPFYATYGTETYRYVHNGIPSYWMNPRDLDANQESPLVYLFHCVLGHHGLISLTPVLCFSVCGWFLVLRRNTDAVRREIIVAGAALTMVTLGFYLTRTQNYNYGGNSVGLRWMLWLSPFWWTAMVPALERISRRSLQTFALILLMVSMVSIGWSLNRPWRPSWLFEQMQTTGWINYRTPVQPFDPPRTSVFAAWPDRAGITMAWRSSNGERLTVTSQNDPVSGESQPSNNPHGMVLMIELEVAGEKTVIQNLTRPFPDRIGGESPENAMAKAERIFGVEILVNKSLGTDSKSRAIPASVGAWRGFNAAGETWIPSLSDPARAWKVERGAARVLIDDPLLGKCWHRCDVMYCDQLPFGVLEWKTTVTSDATGEIIETTTWVAEQK